MSNIVLTDVIAMEGKRGQCVEGFSVVCSFIGIGDS